MALVCLCTEAFADVTVSLIKSSLNQTVSAPGRTGWRVVESLRLQSRGLQIQKGLLSNSSHVLQIPLDERYDFLLQSSELSSAIFQTIEVIVDTQGKQVLQIRLRSTADTPRHCLSDSTGDIVFLVCTQLFENREAIPQQAVIVKAPTAGVPSEGVAVKHHEIVHPMTLRPTRATKPVFNHAVVHKNKTRLPAGLQSVQAMKHAEQAMKHADSSDKREGEKATTLPGETALLYGFAPVKTMLPTEKSSKPALRLQSEPQSKLDASDGASISTAIPELQGIRFNLSGSPAINFPISGTFQFSKRKAGSNSYKILIRAAHVAHAGLLRPHFVPMEFPGITAIDTAKTEDGITLTVFVEQGTRLHVERTATGLRANVQI